MLKVRFASPRSPSVTRASATEKAGVPSSSVTTTATLPVTEP